MFALLVAPLLAAAPFEGVVHMKIHTGLGEGVMRISVAKPGVRSEGEIKLGARNLKTTLVVRADRPQQSYLFDHFRAQWQPLPAESSAPKEGPFSAKKLAAEKVAGIDCQHVLLTDEKGGELEYWTTRKLLAPGEQSALVARAQKTPPEVSAALEQAQAQGFVMKMESRRKGKLELSMEVERVEKRKVDPQIFEVSVPTSDGGR